MTAGERSPVNGLGADWLVARYRAARADPRLAVLEGFHAWKHGLRFGAEILHAATLDRAALASLAERLAPDLAGRLEAVEAVPPELFSRLAPTPPATGVLALARRPAPELPAVGTAPLVLLEAPGDLGNIGAVVRVAAAAGAGGVLTIGRHDPWHPAALRGAAGLHFALPVVRVAGPPADARPLVALAPEGEPLGSSPIPPGAVLAFGSERDGLSARLLRQAALHAAIPMRPGVSSLNLATAVAVALYAWRLRC